MEGGSAYFWWISLLRRIICGNVKGERFREVRGHLLEFIAATKFKTSDEDSVFLR